MERQSSAFIGGSSGSPKAFQEMPLGLSPSFGLLLGHPCGCGWKWMAQETILAVRVAVRFSVVKELLAQASNTLRRGRMDGSVNYRLDELGR